MVVGEMAGCRSGLLNDRTSLMCGMSIFHESWRYRDTAFGFVIDVVVASVFSRSNRVSSLHESGARVLWLSDVLCRNLELSPVEGSGSLDRTDLPVVGWAASTL